MPRFPEVIYFEGLGPCYYTQGKRRTPLKGEYYLSGANVGAWRAYSDLDHDYRIVTPTHKAVRVEAYRKGPPITLDRKGPNS